VCYDYYINQTETQMKNPIRTFRNGNDQSFIEQARAVSRNLGIRAGAGMLRNKGYSVEAALFILLGV
jgi:hypothetical protein